MIDFPLTSFYFQRHGQTDWNKQRIYMGTRDIPLNDVGRAQAHDSYHLLKNEPITHIVSSPLSRASETAQILSQKMGISIAIVDELKECTLGVMEGKPYDDQMLLQNGQDTIFVDGTPAPLECADQVITAVKKALQLGPNVLIVSHGSFYATLCRAMGWPIIDLSNCEAIFHKAPLHHTHPWTIYSLAKGTTPDES